MKLPDAGLATVPERKITHYLLNPAHPAGGSKAVFFHRFGYTASHWQILAEDLMRHARENEIVAMETGALWNTVCRGRLSDGTGWNPLEHPQRMVYRSWHATTPLCNRAPSAQIMKAVNELDVVALTCDLPAHGLVRGDVGTVVLIHGKGEAFEVEFVGYDGHTVALVTLEANQLRPLDSHDIPHARELTAA